MTSSTIASTGVSLHEQPQIQARRWFLLAIMCTSLVVVVMAVSGLQTALPTIQRELGASSSDLQWIVDSFAVTFAGLLLSAGAIGDRFGRRNALGGGLALFALGATLGGLASNVMQLIASRAVMGVGAAFVMPSTLSMTTAIFSPEERPRAIGIWAAFAGAGATIGPILTGALLGVFWWGSTLLANVPVVVGTMAAVWCFAPDSRDDTRTPLDPIGALTSLTGLSALIFGIIQGPEDGWTSRSVVAALGAAAITLTLLILWERRKDHPMLPLALFRDPRVSTASAVIAITFAVIIGLFFLLTQYLQVGRGYSPFEAGLASVPAAVVLLALSPKSPALTSRYGATRVMAAGLIVVAAAFGILITLSATTPYFVISLALALLGAGMSLTATPATTEIMAAVPLTKAGVGSAVNDTTREVGGAVGIALFGSIANIANIAYRSSIDLSGLNLSHAERAAANESVGRASGIGSGHVLARATAAFAHAFRVANAASLAVALVAAVAILATSRRERAARSRNIRPQAG